MRRYRFFGDIIKAVSVAIGILIVLWILVDFGFLTTTDVFCHDTALIFCTIISAFLVYLQLRESTKIAESEFILNLNNLFVTNEEYTRMYDKLSKHKDGKRLILKDSEISNYLTFFEVFWILKKDGAIDFEVFDDLFAYRFFLAVHNPYIQRRKLVKYPTNFKNIYKLEKEWIEYRRKVGKGTYGMKYELKKVIEIKQPDIGYMSLIR